jgi:hypothetical protein
MNGDMMGVTCSIYVQNFSQKHQRKRSLLRRRRSRGDDIKMDLKKR